MGTNHPTLAEVKEAFTDVFILEDDMVIDLILAITLGSKMPGDPIWLMIVGASSSGKSELVQMIGQVPFAHQVSNLTENTFLSGMNRGHGEETSLLHQIGPSGMIVMKDYTSILTMKADKRDVIVGQMREIFDGEITKKTGNGNSNSWRGKLNFIGAVTDTIYVKEGESAGMGRRAINYVMPELDDDGRIALAKKARENINDIAEKREHIQKITADFIMHKLENIPDRFPDVDPELSEELIHLANFSTRVRTPVQKDYKGNPQMVHSLEAPMRMSQQVHKLAQYLMWLKGGELKPKDAKILYKICLDSIPKQIRMVLRVLAKYKSVEAKGVAHLLNRPTDWARMWLQDLNMLQVCRRVSTGGLGPDEWVINPRYKTIMLTYDDIEETQERLVGQNGDSQGSYDDDDIDPGLLMDIFGN